jgi:heme oxygenase
VIAPLSFSEPTVTLRDTLRSATRAPHEALDAALMPPGSPWTRDRYVRFLRGTLAVLLDTERTVADTVRVFRLPDAPSRVDRLMHDLAALEADAAVDAVVLPHDLRVPSAGYGAAYVIEGSMLGGQHVAHAVERDLGLDADALTYLRAPGAVVGERWATFVVALEGFGGRAAPVEWRDATRAALDTFAAFDTAFRREGLL